MLQHRLLIEMLRELLVHLRGWDLLAVPAPGGVRGGLPHPAGEGKV